MHAGHDLMHDPQHRFHELLTRHERPLIRYAHSITGNLEDARDVVQDVFVKLSQNLHAIEEARLTSWLFTVCKNRALDHLRKNQRLIVMENETLDRETSTSPRPGDELDQRETASDLRALIEQLPARQREAVRLKFIAGLDYKEISRAMQTSLGNVGYLIHHGVQALRVKWREMEQGAVTAPMQPLLSNTQH